MVNIKGIERYCCEDISLIENYDRAISSDEPFDCHHRNEITLNKSANGLKEMGLYWNRPANELIFLTHSEHMVLHNKGENNPLYGKRLSEETRKKMSEAHNGKNNSMYGKQHTEETRKKISDALKGKQLSTETRKKMSEARKERKWMNDGIQQKRVHTEEINLYLGKGYSFGRLK